MSDRPINHHPWFSESSGASFHGANALLCSLGNFSSQVWNATLFSTRKADQLIEVENELASLQHLIREAVRSNREAQEELFKRMADYGMPSPDLLRMPEITAFADAMAEELVLHTKLRPLLDKARNSWLSNQDHLDRYWLYRFVVDIHWEDDAPCKERLALFRSASDLAIAAWAPQLVQFRNEMPADRLMSAVASVRASNRQMPAGIDIDQWCLLHIGGEDPRQKALYPGLSEKQFRSIGDLQEAMFTGESPSLVELMTNVGLVLPPAWKEALQHLAERSSSLDPDAKIFLAERIDGRSADGAKEILDLDRANRIAHAEKMQPPAAESLTESPAADHAPFL